MTTLRIINNRIKYCTYNSDQDEPLGFFVGWCFLGYVQEREKGSGPRIYLLSTQSKYVALTSSIRSGNDPKMVIYNRNGTYERLYYSKIVTCRTRLTPTDQQQAIVDQILAMYREGINVIVAYISGEPGTGKSTVPIIISQILDSPMCFSWDPRDPGDNLTNLITRVNAKPNHPLIVVMEEADVVINDVLKGVRSHKDIPVPIRNKSEWNTMLDNLGLLHQELILIMTSNISPDQIADQSVLRDGRCHFRFALDQQITAKPKCKEA